MPKIDEFWTDDPPEVGREYWISWWIGEPYNRYARTGRTTAANSDVLLWNQPNSIQYIRSILPIPDPIPPPLPKEKK